MYLYRRMSFEEKMIQDIFVKKDFLFLTAFGLFQPINQEKLAEAIFNTKLTNLSITLI